MQYGDTSLIIAARSGNTQAVKELLYAGVSVDISNNVSDYGMIQSTF